MKNIDDSILEFEKICVEIDEFISQDHNESDTRSKIIDNYILE